MAFLVILSLMFEAVRWNNPYIWFTLFVFVVPLIVSGVVYYILRYYSEGKKRFDDGHWYENE